MQEFELTSAQIDKLSKNGYLVVADNCFVEVYNDNLVLNQFGTMHFLDNLTLRFCSQGNCIGNKVEYIQKLLFKNLFLKDYPIMCIYCNLDEFEFRVLFSSKSEGYIYVCSYDVAIKNTNAICEKPIKIKETEEFIGLYKRLGKSLYYFRWFNE
mgnify:CR=1 FL=1